MRRIKRSDKRGVSPIVATVLLIAIVIVIIAIIFIWSRSFIKESVQKKGLPAEQACSQINLQVSCAEGTISITNLGNIPVYQFDVKKRTTGRTTLQHSNDEIGIGESVEIYLGSECPSDYKIIPAVLGSSEGQNKVYTCVNNEF